MEACGFWNPQIGPEAKILVNRAQAVPKDSPSFCLRRMILHRRSLICAREKKVRQNFCLKTSHLPYTLRTLRLYHCFGLPVNENGKSINFKVFRAIPSIVMHEQSCSNSLKWVYGFSSSVPAKDCSLAMAIKPGRSSLPLVRIGCDEDGGLQIFALWIRKLCKGRRGIHYSRWIISRRTKFESRIATVPGNDARKLVDKL
jgi:hypothetical protein